jgi:O-antigen ligase
MLKFWERFIEKGMLIKGSLSFYLAYFSLIILPIYYRYLPPIMILWLCVRLFEIKYSKWEFSLLTTQRKVFFGLFLIFFAWQIFGMFYSDNSKEGWRIITLRISFLVYPLVLIIPGDTIKRKINILLKIFALSTLLFLFIGFLFAFYRSSSFKDGTFIFKHNLDSEPWLSYFYSTHLAIFQHPSYLAMYVLFSLFIAFESLFSKLTNWKLKTFWIFSIIVFLISIYLLSSRAAIIATLITIPIYFILKFRIKGIKFSFSLIPLLGLFIIIPIFVSNPRMTYYLKGDSKKEWSSKVMKESRLTLWESAFIIIKRNLIFGVGTGDTQDELNNEYKIMGDQRFIKNFNYNTHNQFIDVFLGQGLIGLIIFLSIFVMMFYIALSEKNILYSMFLSIVLFSFFFETMLNRLAGVSFFALFSFLLLHVKAKEELIETY